MPTTTETTTYQVLTGYSYKGYGSGMTLELDPNAPDTTDAVSDGIISESINPLLAPSKPSQFVEFRRRIQGSSEFFKVYTVSKTSGAVSAAYALLMNAIDNRELEDMAFALQDLVDELDSAGQAFTEGEKTEINGWLTECGFLIQVA